LTSKYQTRCSYCLLNRCSYVKTPGASISNSRTTFVNKYSLPKYIGNIRSGWRWLDKSTRAHCYHSGHLTWHAERKHGMIMSGQGYTTNNSYRSHNLQRSNAKQLGLQWERKQLNTLQTCQHRISRELLIRYCFVLHFMRSLQRKIQISGKNSTEKTIRT
jgi:hypothetical protein